jgi:hypothetical protein
MTLRLRTSNWPSPRVAKGSGVDGYRTLIPLPEARMVAGYQSEPDTSTDTDSCAGDFARHSGHGVHKLDPDCAIAPGSAIDEGGYRSSPLRCPDDAGGPTLRRDQGLVSVRPQHPVAIAHLTMDDFLNLVLTRRGTDLSRVSMRIRSPDRPGAVSADPRRDGVADPRAGTLSGRDEARALAFFAVPFFAVPFVAVPFFAALVAISHFAGTVHSSLRVSLPLSPITTFKDAQGNRQLTREAARSGRRPRAPNPTQHATWEGGSR